MMAAVVALFSGWILAGPFLVLFGLLALINAILFVARYILRRPRAPSMVPLIGGIAGALAFQAAPIDWMRQFAWAPLLADVGCVPWIVFVCWITYRERRRWHER